MNGQGYRMQRWRGCQAQPGGWGRSVVTIGVFDGVHRGHQAIIGHAVKRAEDLGLESVVMTFDPHPSEVVRPGSHPAVLTEPAYKAALIEALGADVLCVVPFTVGFSQLSPDAFAHDVLADNLHAKVVVVAENFQFGHGAAGGIALLRRLGRTFGFDVESAPLVTEDGTVFSSTYVRSRVAAGDVAAARLALGRPHRIEGVVVPGERRGRELGFPTANLRTGRHAAVPAHGVYAGWLVLDDRRWKAAISIGTKPTFDGSECAVEAHLPDFDGDLYGEHVALEFCAHLRETLRYDSVEKLTAQLRADLARVRDLPEHP